MMITRKRKMRQSLIRTFMLSSNLPAPFPPALPNIAKTGTLLTLTRLNGVTSCTLLKEKERHPKVEILFFSPKDPKARAKAKARARARASKAKARAIAKEKA